MFKASPRDRAKASAAEDGKPDSGGGGA
jgi:hypothetical protein